MKQGRVEGDTRRAQNSPTDGGIFAVVEELQVNRNE